MSDSYKDGFKTGVNWKFGHVPGGPFACDKELDKKRAEWKKGFFDGLKKCRYKNKEPVLSLIKEIENKD